MTRDDIATLPRETLEAVAYAAIRWFLGGRTAAHRRHLLSACNLAVRTALVQPEGGTVLDPFGGAGTVGLVADRLKRNAVLIELNPDYADMARRRIQQDAGMFAEVAAE